MALRIKAAACLILWTAGIAAAQSYPARHRHLHKSGAGTLTFSDEGVQWEESAKDKPRHSWTRKYADLKRLEIAPDHVRVETYDRDGNYVFEKIPAELAPAMFAKLIDRLDQRFFAHVSEPGIAALYEMPAKFGSSNGTLKVGDSRIVFEGPESRTWRYSDIQSVSTSGPFELTFQTLEGENRLDLKEALAEERYNALWRRISESNGLKIYGAADAAHAQHEH